MAPPQMLTQSQFIDRDPRTAVVQNNPGVMRQAMPPQVVGNMGGPRPPVMMNNINNIRR